MVLLICILWVGYDFHTAQSVPLEKGDHMGHIFTCCMEWHDSSSTSEDQAETPLRLLGNHVFTSAEEWRGLSSWGYNRLFENFSVIPCYHYSWHLCILTIYLYLAHWNVWSAVWVISSLTAGINLNPFLLYLSPRKVFRHEFFHFLLFYCMQHLLNISVGIVN